MPDGDERAATPPASATDPVPSEEVRANVLALYQKHGTALRRFVLGVVGDPEATSDILQETLLKALARGHEVGPRSFKGWLFQVAYHEALAVRRRERAGEKARRSLSRFGPIASGGQGVDAPVILSETSARLKKALDGLPKEQLRVVEARIYQDKTFPAIAQEFGLPLGTVLTRMRLGLARLRRSLPPNEPEG